MISNPEFTVGNTINIAVAIYKKNWQNYLKLSLIGHLWLLIPIYGLARYFAIAAWIGKLGLEQLTNKDESLDGLSAETEHFSVSSLIIRMLFVSIRIFLLFSLSTMGTFVVIFFCGLISAFLPIRLPSITENTTDMIIGFFTVICFSLIGSWLYMFVFAADAISHEGKFINSIKQSIRVAQARKIIILQIIGLTFSIVFSLWLINYLLLSFAYYYIALIVENIASINLLLIADITLAFILIPIWFISVNLLAMPLWQLVKSVVYYNFILENYGWDLKLNRN